MSRSGTFERALRLTALLIVLSLSLTLSARIANAAASVRVMTTRGPIRGELADGLSVFRGIPYAVAPVGAQRFRPAEPLQQWMSVRPAIDFAPACPQELESDPTENGQSVQSEDCLAVNVWTPKTDSKKRPVMVWIHGGAFVVGSARNTWYDGARLAARGDVVVVTIQYRLGVLGFLDLSQVGGAAFTDSGNLGMLDQIAALRWVRDNIAAFGGDPHNVTIFGESAGGASVAMLLTIPAAKGLFHRAIIESGPPILGPRTRERSLAATQAFMEIAGVHDIAGLQALDTAAILDARGRLNERRPDLSVSGGVLDGKTIPGNIMELIEHGAGATVPLMVGTLLDEAQYMDTVQDLRESRRPYDVLQQQLTTAVGASAGDILRSYFESGSEPYADRVIAFVTDTMFRIPSIRIAEAAQSRQPTWMYLFTYRSTSTYKGYRAAHAMELPFVFGNLEHQDVIAFTGRDPDRKVLSTRMQDAWIAFARSGDPNTQGLPPWPRYDEHTRATMEFGKVSRVVEDPLSARRRAWDGVEFDGKKPTLANLTDLLFDVSGQRRTGTGPIATTSAGQVQGQRENGISVFRGIPYAEPPVSDLRFLPARPIKAWTGVRPALDFGPACPQVLDADPTENNDQVQSEDCLTLNVWAPHVAGAKQPVMVWIHGGALAVGSARNTWYDGARLAARGNVVVVTLQYRLNVLGFLDLSREGGPAFASSGNLGILDQIAALRWVRENIAAFGGDPQNITIFGESAGGASVATLLASPLALGLFDKAIIQSMSPQLGAPREPHGESAQALMQAAGVRTIAGLQALSLDKVLAAAGKAAVAHPDATDFTTKIDQALLNANALKLIEAGNAARVPVMIGTTLDEMEYWDTIEGLGQRQKPPVLLADQLNRAFGQRAPTIHTTYLSNSTDTYGDKVIALNSDVIFRIPSIRLAEAIATRQPTWMYLFTYRSSSTYRNYRSAHAMELPFVFGNLEAQDVITFTGRDPDRQRLSEQMQDAWIAFSRSGDPNAAGLPQWPRYDTHTRATMEFGKATQVVEDPLSARRNVWDGLPFNGITPDPTRYMELMISNGHSR